MRTSKKATARRWKCLIAVSALGLGIFATASSVSAEPFKLGVEERGYLQDPYQGEAGYPAPEMVQPYNGGVQQNQGPPLNGGASMGALPPRKPISAGASRTVALPPPFLGNWVVQGMRKEVKGANPNFQQGAANAFRVQTRDVWVISGNPKSGYAFSNPQQGVKTKISVDKVDGNTAFIRYQHPINNTMAQEAIVMQLLPGAARFNGLERISIVKKGEAPRAQVTYELVGTRQR